MKYCINYQKNFPYYDMVDEVNLRYEKDFGMVLMDFLQENEQFLEKELVICLETMDEVTDLIHSHNLAAVGALCGKYPQLLVKIRLPYEALDQDPHELEVFEKYSIPIFFKKYINNWDELRGILKLGVSDVYITEDLGFELEAVAKLVHSACAQVRIFPNVTQSAWAGTPSMKTFFLRPEDLSMCEHCVDVVEFWNYEDKLKTLFKIYAIDKKWPDQLGYIIQGFEVDLDSRHLLPDFIKPRLVCGKRCVRGKHCSLCERAIDLAAILDEKGLILNYMQVEDWDLEDDEEEDLIEN